MAGQSEQLEGSIQIKLESLTAYSSKACIYKVPEHLRRVKEECYRPTVVSIGPLFYELHQADKTMQDLKLRHLECFLEHSDQAYTLQHYINMIREMEEEIRQHYAENITLSSIELIEMVLLDAAFILHLFMSVWGPLDYGTSPLADRYDLIYHAARDLCLVENQLPFFILKAIYDIAYAKSNPDYSFLELAGNFVDNLRFLGTELPFMTTYDSERIEDSDIKHLADLIRMCLLSHKLRKQQPKEEQEIKPIVLPLSAAKLKAAGIKFRAIEGLNLLDIKFANGVLEIPGIAIGDATESILRSIIFLEQCHYNNYSYFIDYIRFLDALINTQEDVQILIESGIIFNALGDDEALVQQFNTITNQVLFIGEEFYYAKISSDLNAHAKTQCNHWMAILKTDYFAHPWAAISVAYAIVLLVLTVLQVYTGFKALPKT